MSNPDGTWENLARIDAATVRKLLLSVRARCADAASKDHSYVRSRVLAVPLFENEDYEEVFGDRLKVAV
jgi:hypothetical protein